MPANGETMPVVFEAAPDAAIDARLCDLAARYKLVASLEPMPWVDVSNITKAQRVIEGAARANGAL